MAIFKNILTSKILSFTALAVFLLNTTVYGIDLPAKRHLRPSMITNSKGGQERVEETAQELSGKQSSSATDQAGRAVNAAAPAVEGEGADRALSVRVAIDAITQRALDGLVRLMQSLIGHEDARGLSLALEKAYQDPREKFELVISQGKKIDVGDSQKLQWAYMHWIVLRAISEKNFKTPTS